MTWEGRGIFEVSSADPDSTSPVWVDFTPRIRDVIQAPTLTTGRQNDLERSEPSVFSATLDNVDDALTYGNTSSPYPWWGPGRKCRHRDVIAGTNVPLFTGYLQVPTELLTTAGIEQRVQITAIDRLGRLGSSEPFPSALGAYIRNTVDLKGYWPMTDPAQPFYGVGPTTSPLLVNRFVIGGGSAQTATITPAMGLAPIGGEGSSVRFLTGQNGGVVSSYAQTSWPLAFAPAIGAGDSVTIVMWASVTGTAAATQEIASITTLGSGLIGLDLTRSLATGNWTLTATSAMTGSIAIGAPGTGLFPLGIRLSIAASTMELWLGGQRFTTTLAGAPPTGNALFQGIFGSLPIDYDLSHMQVYVGPTYSYNDFLTQIAMGYSPLERQSTGDRIRTIATYAGIPAAELTQIDPGCSVMQRAQLSGQTPLDAMRDAERTEQGLLYCDGNGNLIFKDRRTLYNI